MLTSDRTATAVIFKENCMMEPLNLLNYVRDKTNRNVRISHVLIRWGLLTLPLGK